MINNKKSERRRTNGSGALKYFVKQVCPVCKQERWIAQSDQYAPTFTGLCATCSRKVRRGEKNNFWKGGRHTTKAGYINIYLYPDDFFYAMTRCNNYVLEHRLVMAKYLGRCLHSWEIVHHKNHIRDDNRIENLQLVSGDKHNQIGILVRRVEHLENLLRDSNIPFGKNHKRRVRVEV